MKFKLFLPVVIILALAACSGAGNSSAIPTVVLGGGSATQAPAAVSSASASGDVTASGIIVPDQVARMAFSLPGEVRQVTVKVGDQVQKGQPLVQLDDSSQQIALAQAAMALQQFNSPEAIAIAKLAVTSAQKAVIDAQYGVNNQQYWQNNPLVQDQYAKVVIAKDTLDKAQQAYESANGGDYINNPGEAVLYQALYNAQQAYNTAQYYYSLYSQKPTDRQVNEAQASLDLANATLTNAQNYLAALTGGNVPADASGAALTAFKGAQLGLQVAQNALAATRLMAPFSGEVASVTVSPGDYVLPGQVVLVISDVNHMHVETTDLSERDVPGVKLGQAAIVSIKAFNQEVEAQVTAISPLAQSLGGDVVYTVTLSLGELPPGVLAGMSVEVHFNASP